MMKRKIFLFLVFLSTSILLNMADTHAQCAMCKAVAESSSGNVAAKNLNFGILFLMSIPYLLVSVIAYAMYRHYKSSRKSAQGQ
ncbi:hypothetical protein [Thermaurantimonas aggregans]|uniref:hypothetical protein n=1 Tax=Thermaurantimonas aggregans TaxID=2173829 RepID=UPI001FE90330|nr:hypothetical protein [Thermaurantimonas aggregans]MCX8148203.1 hypothetical protein [Thermaurantimonas aggregans]